MEEAGGHTFRSYVRGKVVDFSPENLRNVMRFRAHVENAATDFETRKEHDQQLDQVLAELCIPGATWKLSTGQLRVPIQLRRQELNPAEEGNEGQAHDYDYHHQPEYEHQQHDYEQPQPEFEHHQEFNEPININIKKTLTALKLSCRT
ncbi:hypothetical protein PIB30_098757 [Stylosanthes scabra]|uniref:Uncharacterized protein n=1 Tax=Stylosanthes scabra TaxID=79078 RepID=A0ABU6SWX2_9FABA|nr:hypothetical protein [Stylosanthes scabra]